MLTIKQQEKFNVVHIYINNFVFESKNFKVLEYLKDQLIKKFIIKYFKKVKIIIEQKITQDFIANILKVV